MKRLLIALVMAGAGAAGAQVTCTQTGNFTHCSDGSSAQRIGNMVYGNDGSTRQRIGNTTYINPGYQQPQVQIQPVMPMIQPIQPLQPLAPLGGQRCGYINGQYVCL